MFDHRSGRAWPEARGATRPPARNIGRAAPVTRSAHDVVVASARATQQAVGTKLFDTTVACALLLLGRRIATHVSMADRPGVFVPVDVLHSGRERAGALLALEDRAIVAWTAGVLRPRYHEAVLRIAQIRAVETTLHARRGGRPGREGLRILTPDRDCRLVFANVVPRERSLVPWIAGRLAG